MALFIDGQLLQDPTNSLNGMSSFFKIYQTTFEPAALTLKNEDVEKVSIEDGTLYVNQHEFAVICADSSCVFSKLGTDMATTCHMVSLYHAGTKVAAVGHFDGPSTQQGVVDMVNQTLEEVLFRSNNAYGDAVDLDLQIIGGFSDKRGLSDEVSMELLTSFYHFKPKPGLPPVVRINLTMFCASKLNNTMMPWNGTLVVAPKVRGIVCDANSGNVRPAWFNADARSPIGVIRGVRSLTAVKNFPGVYRTRDNCFVMKSFSYGYEIRNIPFWLKQPDDVLRNRFSTSPKVEASNFCEILRQDFRFIEDHPNPEQSVFLGQDALVFRAVKTGLAGIIEWKSMNSITQASGRH